MAKKLLLFPCPFCGAPPACERWGGKMHTIYCAQQGCVTVDSTEDKLAEAARRWNTRHPVSGAGETNG